MPQNGSNGVIPFVQNSPRQLIVSEDSEVSHIREWLQSGSRDVMYVIAKNANEIVRACVDLAHEFRLRIEYLDPDVERELTPKPALALV